MMVSSLDLRNLRFFFFFFFEANGLFNLDLFLVFFRDITLNYAAYHQHDLSG